MTDSVYRFDETSLRYLACENGEVRTFAEVGVGRTTVYGSRLVETCSSGDQATSHNEDALPCIRNGVRPSQDTLNRLFYAAPNFRKPEELLSICMTINRELAPNTTCYVLGINPLIIGFEEGTDVAADEKDWLQHKTAIASTTQQVEIDQEDFRERASVELVTRSMLNAKIASIAIYPPRITEHQMVSRYEDNGTMLLLQFREPQTIASLLEARCDAEAIADVVSERMQAPVRLALQ